MSTPDDRPNSRIRPQILCVMMLPPDLNGHGGSQRAWRLVEALSKVGEVHFVLIYYDGDRTSPNTSLTPLEPLVTSITRIRIPEWKGRKKKLLRVIHPAVSDVLRFGSFAAPRFSAKALKKIADLLPLRDPDIIFAGRITCATIVQSMLEKKMLSGSRKVVDFDDINSKFRRRELRQTGASWGIQGHFLGKVDAFLIEREERRIARAWDRISVCSDEDVAELQAQKRKAVVAKVPNTVGHDLLQKKHADSSFRCLFVGNLGFAPNIHGLNEFIRVAWPQIRRSSPEICLSIVGFNASEQLLSKSGTDGITVHTNVPDLRPYYEQADLVIAPILFGGGTRIKIVEAMAYGRPVVSTSIGAEGLGAEDGHEIIIADTMEEFARLIVDASLNRMLLQSVAVQARAFQRKHFGPETFGSAMKDFLSFDEASKQTSSRA